MSEKADVWMPLYIGDYLADTQRLSTIQHGAYFLLMLDYWKNGPLPDDDSILASITKLAPDAWSIHRALLERFFRISDGHWHHKRIDAEREKAVANQIRRTERAKAAADARWSANGNAPSIPDGQHGASPPPSPSPSPLSAPAQDRASDEALAAEPPCNSLAIVAAWNQVAPIKGLPECKTPISAERRQKIRARIKEHGEAVLVAAILDIPNKAFLGSGQGQWRADLGKMMISDKTTGLLEGRYDQFRGKSGGAWDRVPEMEED